MSDALKAADSVRAGRRGPDWVLAEKFAELTGHSVNSVKIKRNRGIWPDGTVTKVQGGRLYVSLGAFDHWVETGEIRKP